ncbi:MAG: hypothetical protein ABI627_26810 [Polyangiaceae bacterium]
MTSATPITNSLPDQRPDDGDFEPEEGTFGPSAPDPYELRLHEALFEHDVSRICQLVTVPSFDAESAVYIVLREQGAPLVVSRRLNEQLWALMMTQIEIQAGGAAVGKSISTAPSAQVAALTKIQASTDTDRAEIDPSSVDVLARACESTLQRSHYRRSFGGIDGVTYHAGHWKPGLFLGARTHSPAEGTIARDYIALGESLRAYAASPSSERDAVKVELLAKAERLIARARIKH